MTDVQSTKRLSDYTEAIRRKFVIVLVVMLVGAVIGFSLLLIQKRVYVAEASVQVRPIISQSSSPNLDESRQVNIQSEVKVAGSQRVAEWALALAAAGKEKNEGKLQGNETFTEDDVIAAAAAAVADGDYSQKSNREAAQDQLEELEVTVAEDSNVLEFVASSSDAVEASTIAQTSAVAYLQFRADQATIGRLAARERLANREIQLVSEVRDLSSQAGAARTSGEEARALSLEAGEVAKRQELADIGSNYAALEVGTVDAGGVISDAVLPAGPQGLPSFFGLIVGGFVGLLVGVSAAYLLDQQDDRIRSARVEIAALGVHVLGSAPIARSAFGSRRSSRTASVISSDGESSDAYRRLYGSLAFTLDKENTSALLVAGVTNRNVGELVLANLAATAARSGRRTLLIGADMHNPQMASLLGLPPRLGLRDVVTNGASLEEAVQVVPKINNLRFLGAGIEGDHPEVVVQSESFGRLMTAVEADYDLVLVAAPPVLRAADTVDIARSCGGAVIIVDSASESRHSIAESVGQLQGVGSSIVGVVVAERVDRPGRK